MRWLETIFRSKYLLGPRPLDFLDHSRRRLLASPRLLALATMLLWFGRAVMALDHLLWRWLAGAAASLDHNHPGPAVRKTLTYCSGFDEFSRTRCVNTHALLWFPTLGPIFHPRHRASALIAPLNAVMARRCSRQSLIADIDMPGSRSTEANHGFPSLARAVGAHSPGMTILVYAGPSSPKPGVRQPVWRDPFVLAKSRS